MHREGAYGVVNDLVRPSIVVDVDGDAAESGDLAGELVQTSVVLALALVGFGHDGLGIDYCYRLVVNPYAPVIPAMARVV